MIKKKEISPTLYFKNQERNLLSKQRVRGFSFKRATQKVIVSNICQKNVIFPSN